MVFVFEFLLSDVHTANEVALSGVLSSTEFRWIPLLGRSVSYMVPSVTEYRDELEIRCDFRFKALRLIQYWQGSVIIRFIYFYLFSFQLALAESLHNTSLSFFDAMNSHRSNSLFPMMMCWQQSKNLFNLWYYYSDVCVVVLCRTILNTEVISNYLMCNYVFRIAA